MRATSEAKQLKLFMLKKHPGFLFIEDKGWIVSRALMFQETEDTITFIDWVVRDKPNYENMFIHTYRKGTYGKLWRCWDNVPTIKQRRKWD